MYNEEIWVRRLLFRLYMSFSSDQSILTLNPPKYTEQIQQEQNILENAGQRSMPRWNLNMRFLSIRYLKSGYRIDHYYLLTFNFLIAPKGLRIRSYS
jgi:hypothetical protein